MALRVLVTGVAGRMGRSCVRAIQADPACALVAGTARPGSGLDGQDAGALAGGTPGEPRVYEDFVHALEESHPDVVIDFTVPDASAAHADACGRTETAMVIGTTGLGAAVRERIERATRRAPVVLSPNMSVGVAALLQIAEHLARVLGKGWDLEVVELHHRQKRDAPSGTALQLAEVIARASGGDASAFRLARAGQVGPRPPGEIGVQTLRGGDVVGEHTVFFLGEGERLELTHRATSRDQFARGAVRAARWVRGRRPGLYGMQDVLGA